MQLLIDVLINPNAGLDFSDIHIPIGLHIKYKLGAVVFEFI